MLTSAVSHLASQLPNLGYDVVLAADVSAGHSSTALQGDVSILFHERSAVP